MNHPPSGDDSFYPSSGDLSSGIGEKAPCLVIFILGRWRALGATIGARGPMGAWAVE
jgi:hypothetical protein